MTQYNASRHRASEGWFEPFDELLGGRAEDVVVGDLAPLLGLDPLGSKAMEPTPLLELWPQADHMKKWLLTAEPPDGRAVIGVEVAMHGDAAGLGEGDRLFDLATVKVFLAHQEARRERIAGSLAPMRPIRASGGPAVRRRASTDALLVLPPLPSSRLACAPNLTAPPRVGPPDIQDGRRRAGTAAWRAPAAARSRRRRSVTPPAVHAPRRRSRPARPRAPRRAACRKGAAADHARPAASHGGRRDRRCAAGANTPRSAPGRGWRSS